LLTKDQKKKLSALPDPLKKRERKKEEKVNGLSFMHLSEFKIEFERESPPLFRHFEMAFPHDSMSRFNIFDFCLDEMALLHI
jgi:hypothetical protein